MFEDLIRELKRMEKPTRIAIDVGLDDERYFDRACPSPECGVAFKVFFEDWRDLVPDESVHCPICGVSEPSTEWNTPDQVEQIRSVALRHVHGQLNNALSRGVRGANRTQSSGLISMTWSYKPGRVPVLVTAAASDVMTQKSTCEACGCRYSSVGAAFFCPACGHNSAITAFDGAVNTVRQTTAALHDIRRVLIDTAGQDAAEDSVRHICENSLVKLVSAFQRLAEAQYDALTAPNKLPARRNVFQNLDDSTALWKAAVGWGYEDLLTPDDLRDLKRYFQQRHLLSHSDGLVDQLYLDRSGDSSYQLGQRLVIRGDAVEQLADLVSGLAQAIRDRLPDA
jgi:uncharacterized Zn finger protein (UPF0148 family)